MITNLNRLSDRNFVAWLAAAVLAVFILGGYIIVHTIQNEQKAAACEAAGGTAYGEGNWLCVK